MWICLDWIEEAIAIENSIFSPIPKYMETSSRNGSRIEVVGRTKGWKCYLLKVKS